MNVYAIKTVFTLENLGGLNSYTETLILVIQFYHEPRKQTTNEFVLVKVVVGIELTWAARKKYWLRPKVSEHAGSCGMPPLVLLIFLFSY